MPRRLGLRAGRRAQPAGRRRRGDQSQQLFLDQRQRRRHLLPVSMWPAIAQLLDECTVAVSIYLWHSNRAKVKCPLSPSRHNQGHFENDRVQATHILCATQLVIDYLTLCRLGDFWEPSQNVRYIRSPFYQKWRHVLSKILPENSDFAKYFSELWRELTHALPAIYPPLAKLKLLGKKYKFNGLYQQTPPPRQKNQIQCG